MDKSTSIDRSLCLVFVESFMDGYMSFGQSGSTTSSTMRGADVFVAFWDDGGRTAKVVDYKLSNYAMVKL